MSRRVMRGFKPELLREARLAADISVTDLARLARVGRRTVQMWESGATSPQVDVLARVCATLGIAIPEVVALPAHETYPADLRVLVGLTQPELGARAAVSTSTVGAIERAEVELSDSTTARLADALGVTSEAYRTAYERARQRPPGEPA